MPNITLSGFFHYVTCDCDSSTFSWNIMRISAKSRSCTRAVSDVVPASTSSQVHVIVISHIDLSIFISPYNVPFIMIGSGNPELRRDVSVASKNNEVHWLVHLKAITEII